MPNLHEIELTVPGAVVARVPSHCRWLLPLLLLLACRAPREAAVSATAPEGFGQVRGWNILSRSLEDARVVVARARHYGINHLQLSHHLVHDLRQIRDDERRARVNTLITEAKAAGIADVLVWDHALYSLSHYPDEFRTGPNRTIDLDNPAFWEWFKRDYREMLDLVPGATGLVLTFIETGARAERQHSLRWKTPAEKLAAVVNAVADVVVGERKLQMYARSFAYTRDEYELTLGALRRIERPEVRLMMKETPHDFFLTHPVDPWVGTIARPTIIEFDTGNEFSGQTAIATTWPEVMLDRWGKLQKRPHVIGYVARTDRYGDTRIVGRPQEILLYALAHKTSQPDVTVDAIYRDFVTERYGAAAVSRLVPAFQAAHDIVTSSLYTFGTSTANHSALAYDPYNSNWARHVSGKWLEPPVVNLGHGIDRQLHYFRDVIESLAPARVKKPEGPLRKEAPWVLAQGWVTAEERMTEAVLADVVKEKRFGVQRATEALAQIARAGDTLSSSDRIELDALFRRTLLTARLHAAVAAAYFGYRVWARGGEHRTASVETTVRDALGEIEIVARAIEDEPGHVPEGQWKWRADAGRARGYVKKIQAGWPEYGATPFPMPAPSPSAAAMSAPGQEPVGSPENP